MAEYCTIVLPKISFSDVCLIARANINGELEIEGDEQNWQSVKVRSPAGAKKPTHMITFNSLKFARGGDEFSRIMLGMDAYFQRIATPHKPVKEELLSRLDGVKWLVGVVADPDFDEQLGHETCIFAIAANLGGMVFDGSRMLDSKGNVILDDEGNTDLA